MAETKGDDAKIEQAKIELEEAESRLAKMNCVDEDSVVQEMMQGFMLQAQDLSLPGQVAALIRVLRPDVAVGSGSSGSDQSSSVFIEEVDA